MLSEPSVGFRLYILFLVLVCIVAAINLFKIWRGAPPFKLSLKRDSPTYIQVLETSATTLRQWIGLTFLGWGIFASLDLVDVCNHFLEQGIVRGAGILLVIIDYSMTLNMTLVVALLLYLARWYMLKRIERLHK